MLKPHFALKKLYPKEFVVVKSQVNVKSKNNDPTQFLYTFFNFGYYFCYLPYRFKMLRNGSYGVKTNRFRQVFCAVIHILTLLRFLTAIREVKIIQSDPSSYFEFVRNTATFIYMFAFIQCFWRKKTIFIEIFFQLQQIKKYNLDYPTKIMTFRTLALTLCCAYALVSIMNFVLGHGIVGIENLSPRNLWKGHAGHALFMILLRDNVTEPADEVLTAPVSVLTIIHIFVQFYFKFGAHYTELIILMCALTLRCLTKGFSYSIADIPGNKVELVLEQFEALKRLSRRVNLAIGAITLCCVFEAMPYYATHIGDILNVSDWFVRFRYLFFVGNFFAIVAVAADITHNADALRNWFSRDENHSTVPSSKLIMLTQELYSNPIGLSAKGLFTITYGFIGTLISIVLTYAVIILQFKSSVVVCQKNDTLTSTFS